MLVTLGTEGLTKSLTMTNKKRPAPGKQKCKSCLPKGQTKIQDFFFFEPWKSKLVLLNALTIIFSRHLR